MSFDPVPWAAGLALCLLSAAVGLTAIRLFKGPSLPDRVVALDLVATIAIGFIVVHAVASRQPVLLAPALALALLAFLGTVTFAYYIGRRK